MKISVCMATYNGALFVKDQISSILNQLNANDELIIVDDCSLDNTFEVLESISDERIFLVRNKKNMGVNQSFSKSISLTTGDFIFLSDQDDIWLEGRVKIMLNHLINSNVDLLTSNFTWIDQIGQPIFVKFDGVNSLSSKKYFKNIFDIFIGKTNYFGCAMLFTKNLKENIVPIPLYIESHDLWIAKIGNLFRSQVHLDNSTFLKRLHGNNTTSTTSNRNLISKLYSRLIFLISIFVILFKKIL